MKNYRASPGMLDAALDQWNAGRSLDEIAEHIGVNRMSLPDILFRVGISYAEVHERGNPIVDHTCDHCGNVFRDRKNVQRKHCSLKCSEDVYAAFKASRTTPERLAAKRVKLAIMAKRGMQDANEWYAEQQRREKIRREIRKQDYP